MNVAFKTRIFVKGIFLLSWLLPVKKTKFRRRLQYFSCGTENKLEKCPGTYWAEHAWDEYMMERELTGFETMANEKQQICFTAGFWKILAAQPGRLLAAAAF